MRRQEELGSDLPMVSGCLYVVNQLLTSHQRLDLVCYALLCFATPVLNMTKKLTMQRVDRFELRSPIHLYISGPKIIDIKWLVLDQV